MSGKAFLQNRFSFKINENGANFSKKEHGISINLYIPQQHLQCSRWDPGEDNVTLARKHCTEFVMLQKKH